jgi:hypothetical protein
MSNNKQTMKLYTEEQVRQAYIDGMDFIAIDPTMYEQDADEYMSGVTPIELPSDEEIMEHIEYLISCRQNLIDNADNMPQHLLEGGCMAFESAIDNARELFLGGNK